MVKFDRHYRGFGLYIGRNNEDFVIEFLNKRLYTKKEVFILEALLAWRSSFTLDKCKNKYGNRLRKLIEGRIEQTILEVKIKNNEIESYKNILKEL
jgi:hypothetical protein